MSPANGEDVAAAIQQISFKQFTFAQRLIICWAVIRGQAVTFQPGLKAGVSRYLEEIE